MRSGDGKNGGCRRRLKQGLATDISYDSHPHLRLGSSGEALIRARNRLSRSGME
jgi:hypothetical protein